MKWKTELPLSKFNRKLTPLPSNYDRFEKIIMKNIFEVDSVVKSLVGNKKVYTISLSYDKVDEFIEMFSKLVFSKNLDIEFNIKFYDERKKLEKKDLEKIDELMFFINNNLKDVINIFSLNLSNNTMGYYNRIINKIFLGNEKIPNFRYRMSIDRHPVNKFDRFELFMSKCLGSVDFSISQLMMLSNDDLEYLHKNNYISNRYYRDATELKKVICDFDRYLINNFDIDKMSEFHKVMVVYNYMKDNIKYAYEATMMVDGVQRINPQSDEANWVFDPYETYIHSRGVCSGQSRLMSILLNHSVLKMDSYVLDGVYKDTLHAWVGIVIDNKLYQCCITMRKPLLSLDMLGYKIDPVYKIKDVYSFGYLTMSDVNMINKDLCIDGKYRKKNSFVRTLEKDKI